MTPNEELGPLLQAPSEYFELRSVLRAALGFPDKRLPLIIGIDGEDGSGKSSLAAWLSWQLEMPAIHLDVFLIEDRIPLSWDYDDLKRAIDGAQRKGRRRPVIVEGIFLLDVLARVDRSPDFFVLVEKVHHAGNLRDELAPYLERAKQKANYVLNWSSKDHDVRVLNAHLR